jgi:hypothetical protein
VFAKAVLNRNFYFLMVVKGNQAQADAFFDSFRYGGNFAEDQYLTYHDTVLNYTV